MHVAGQLKLKIPWKNLYHEPTVAELSGLYVLAVPNTGMKLSRFVVNLYSSVAYLLHWSVAEHGCVVGYQGVTVPSWMLCFQVTTLGKLFAPMCL